MPSEGRGEEFLGDYLQFCDLALEVSLNLTNSPFWFFIVDISEICLLTDFETLMF